MGISSVSLCSWVWGMVLLFGREYKDGGRSWRGVSVKSKVFLVSDEKERYLSHIDTQKRYFCILFLLCCSLVSLCLRMRV